MSRSLLAREAPASASRERPLRYLRGPRQSVNGLARRQPMSKFICASAERRLPKPPIVFSRRSNLPHPSLCNVVGVGRTRIAATDRQGAPVGSHRFDNHSVRWMTPQPRPPITKTTQPIKISFRFTCEATNLPSSRFLDEATGTNAKPPSTFRKVNHGSWGRQEVAASEDARDRDRDRVSRTGRKSARPGGLV